MTKLLPPFSLVIFLRKIILCFPAKMNLFILQSATRGQPTSFLDGAKAAYFVVSSWKLEKINWKNKLFHKKV